MESDDDGGDFVFMCVRGVSTKKKDKTSGQFREL